MFFRIVRVQKSTLSILLLLSAVFAGGCQQVQNLTKPIVRPVSLRDVPAGRLSFRFEPDIAAPAEIENNGQLQIERSTAVQADFDQNRSQDLLERTISSVDKQRVLAVYQGISDIKGDYKLDLYEANGKLIRKIATENLALRFPDSIQWSPDNNSFAFAGVRRVNSPVNQEIVQQAPQPPSLGNENQGENQNANQAVDPNNPRTDEPNSAAPSPVPTATTAPTNVLALRTEQIYTANRDGGELKLLTQTEGLIYFKMIWSPDSQMLAALGCRENEWQALDAQAQAKGEFFRPFGRPRIVEKNGRERRIDDALTNVDPVWSPDSSKVAVAFDKQVRVYDALGNNPTAAALPLQVPLLVAAKTCAEKIALNQSCINVAPIEVNVNNITEQPTDNELTIYLPIVALDWTDEKTLYLQTGFVANLQNGDINRGFMRWHRLNFSPQAVALN